MSNFVWDDTGLNGPKSDLTPEPAGSNPNQWVNAADWNQNRQALLDIQTVARAPPGLFDIRNYGAVSCLDPSNRSQATLDCIAAFESAIAAWTEQNTGFFFGTNGPVGGVYVPAGNWYVSRPIIIPQGCTLFGDGPQMSTILSGVANSAEPTLVPAFAGPLVHLTGKTVNSLFYPAYVAQLVGSTGQALELKTKNDSTSTYKPIFFLDDCYPWGGFLYRYAAQVTLRCWVRVTDLGGQSSAWLIGSRDSRTGQPGAIALDVIQNGGNIQYRATLTTAVSGQQQIVSSNFATGGTPHNLELTYNGAVFDFYVDGVNQGNISMTGKVYRSAFERATLGDNNIENYGFIFQPDGAIDSIELSDIARHTGTSSFTPPTQKYAADSHTLWLCNFDQTQAPSGQPYFVTQSAFLDIATPSATYSPPPATYTDALAQPSHQFPCPHYVRMGGYVQSYVPNVGGVTVQDIQLVPRFNNAGIVVEGASRSNFRRINIFGSSGVGFNITSNNSFYARVEHITVLGWGLGMYLIGQAEHCETEGCNVGFWGIIGDFWDLQDQPSWDSVCSFIWGPLADAFSALRVTDCANDSEVWNFNFQICSAYYFSAVRAVFTDNTWDSHSALPGTPAFLCFDGTGGHKHFGDAFIAAGSAPGISTDGKGPAIGAVDCDECTWPYSPTVTDIDALVTVRTAQATSNQRSLGTNSVPGNNLAGVFSVLHGYTTGGATFAVPEPDANYIVSTQYQGNDGSAPAAGSTSVIGYVTTTTGFTVTLGADPGGTAQLYFSYVIIRVPSGSLYRSYLPTLPSSITNPLVAASPTGDFAVGVTLVPGTGHTLKVDFTKGTQIVAQAGTGLNQWALELTNGSLPSVESIGFGTFNSLTNQVSYSPYQTRGSFVSSGYLYGLSNPGSHNVCFGITSRINGLNGRYAYVAYIDGGYLLASQFVPSGLPGHQPSHGTQGTPLYIGQDSGGTSQLTTATLRNLKIDVDPNKAITIEPDRGPQAGQVEAGFFGEDLVIGYSAGVGHLGGYATQIADAKYGGGKYYWLAARSTLRSTVLLSEMWLEWGQFRPLTAMVVQSGYWDLLSDSKTGAQAWAPILSMMEGVAAAITWAPPTLNAFAWAGFVCPFRNQPGPHSGSANFSIIGQAFVSTWNTSDAQTLTDTYNLVIANATVTAAFNVSINTGDPANPYLRFDSKTAGFAGNGQVTTTNGANGAFWYPGPTTQFGANAQLIITPVGGVPHTFDVVFVTNAATTVNNTIAAMAAHGPTNAVVTGTNVANQLVITANAVGSAGNGIAVESDFGANFNNGFVGFPPVTTLQGGANGARTRVAKIVLCNCIPFGNAPGYSAGKNTERGNFNTLVAAYAAAHGADGVVLADCETTVWNPADHTKVLAANLAADNETLTDAGHTLLYNLINPLLP